MGHRRSASSFCLLESRLPWLALATDPRQESSLARRGREDHASIGKRDLAEVLVTATVLSRASIVTG